MQILSSCRSAVRLACHCQANRKSAKLHKQFADSSHRAVYSAPVVVLTTVRECSLCAVCTVLYCSHRAVLYIVHQLQCSLQYEKFTVCSIYCTVLYCSKKCSYLNYNTYATYKKSARKQFFKKPYLDPTLL